MDVDGSDLRLLVKTLKHLRGGCHRIDSSDSDGFCFFDLIRVTPSVLQLTQSKIPAPRKHFQLPSGSFL